MIKDRANHGMLITKEEICTRVDIAYEQLSKCHTKLCQVISRGDDSEYILDEFKDVLNAILKLEVQLGMLKSEDDMS